MTALQPPIWELRVRPECFKMIYTHLLEKLGVSSKPDSAKVLGLATGEHICLLCLDGRHRLDGVLNNLYFLDGNLVGHWDVVEGGDNARSLLFVAIDEQPAWRVREEECTGEKTEGENNLEGDRESPRDIHNITIDERKTKVNPVCYDGTSCNHRTLDTDEKTTVVRLGCLSLP